MLIVQSEMEKCAPSHGASLAGLIRGGGLCSRTHLICPHNGECVLNRRNEEGASEDWGPGGGGLHPQNSPMQGHLEMAHIVLTFVPEQQFGKLRHPRIPQVQRPQVEQSPNLWKCHAKWLLPHPL